SYQIDPRRLGRSRVDQCAPDRGGLRAVTILLGCKSEKVARLNRVRLEGDRPLEFRFRLGGHDTVGGKNQGLAQGTLALGARTVEANYLAPRFHRLVETPETQIHRRDDLPTPAIIGVTRKMLFYPGHHGVEGRTLVRSGKARRKRLIRQ